MTDFESNLRNQLRSTEHQLEPEVLHGLRSARAKAIASRPSFRTPRVLLPLGGMTLASIAIFFLVFAPLHMSVDQAQPSGAMESSEAQDLDFYYWLAETQDVSGS